MLKLPYGALSDAPTVTRPPVIPQAETEAEADRYFKEVAIACCANPDTRATLANLISVSFTINREKGMSFKDSWTKAAREALIPLVSA